MLLRFTLALLCALNVTSCALTGGAGKDDAPRRDDMIGLWNDTSVGANTGLELAARGTGYIISMGVVPITWNFEAKKQRVRVAYVRGRDQETITYTLRYDAAADTLSGAFYGPARLPHRFTRQSQAERERWEAIKERHPSIARP